MNHTHRPIHDILIRTIALCLCCGTLIALLTLCGGGMVSGISAHGKPSYMCSVDTITGGSSASAHNTTVVMQNYTLALHETIELTGWVTTDEGIHHYEYAWVASTGGTPQWQSPDTQEILPRPDLANANIPYSAGYSTAGYRLTIAPDETMTDGYYDLYVRAITGGEVACDLLALVNVAYGAPDTVRNGVYTFSLPRLSREEGGLINCTLDDQNVLLSANSFIHLGEVDFALFESITITYSLPLSVQSEKQAILGLKSTSHHPYGDGTGKYNLTDNILYMPIDTSTEGKVQTVTLSTADIPTAQGNDVYLCGYLSGAVKIHSVQLTYANQGHTRTAAKLYFAENTASYFTGANKVALTGIQDPVMGDVLRFTVTEDTNDPYVTYHAESMMKEYDVRLTADDYKYMVVLAKAPRQNQHSSMTFYLCAGAITGATEACTYTFSLTKDDKWHYYVLDLSEKDTWEGTIHNWRFDIINGDSPAGNYIDVATVQFFRTAQAAQAAASASTTQCATPYTQDQPLLFQDMREESEVEEEVFVIPEEDGYVVTEAETLPPVEPDAPQGEDTTAPTSPQETTPEAETTADVAQPSSGCTSLVGLSTLPLFVVGLVALKKRKE